MARLRGNRMAMIFQEPMTSLNPAYTIGSQLTESYRRHKRAPQREAVERAVELMGRVGITAPEMRLGQFPHQLSGGLRQRVMIAMALMCDPELLIADEPTTALDVTVQAQILRLLDALKQEFGLSILLITHDLGVVARVADSVSVMYAGEVVEHAPTAQLFARRSTPIRAGCSPASRCPARCSATSRSAASRASCRRSRPASPAAPFARAARLPTTAARAPIPSQTAAPGTPISAACTPARSSPSRVTAQPAIEVGNMRQEFKSPAACSAPQRHVVAVDGVSFACRKAACSASSANPDAASPPWRGRSSAFDADLGRRAGARRAPVRPRPQGARKADPAGVPGPVLLAQSAPDIQEIVALPLVAQGSFTARRDRAPRDEMLDRVGISAEMAGRCPSQLSGGQRQRVAIARALVIKPKVVVCDEPTSALDVSVQAQILNLLADLRRDLNLTYIFISHNLAVVEHVASTVAVMYLGRIVEMNETDALFRAPRHPYTRALLDSVLTPEPGLGVPDVGLGDTIPDPSNIPPGCRFHPRCRIAVERCRNDAADAHGPRHGRMVECHLAIEGNIPCNSLEVNMRKLQFAVPRSSRRCARRSAAPAAAQKSADTLRLAFRDSVPNIDPYYNNQRTGLVDASPGLDMLVYRDPDTFEIKPLLATEWKPPDPTTIDFTLRQGVKFHDGSPFSADDVVYTINLGPTRTSKVSTPVELQLDRKGREDRRALGPRQAQAADPCGARILRAGGADLAQGLSREGRRRKAMPRRRSAPAPTRSPSSSLGVSIDFERFEDYYDGSPKGKPAIKKITMRFVPDAATEMTELLAAAPTGSGT